MKPYSVNCRMPGGVGSTEWNRVRLTLPVAMADWVSAEVIDWGSPGVEVCSGPPPGRPSVPEQIALDIYFTADQVKPLRKRLGAFLLSLGPQAKPFEMGPVESVPPVDWAEQWRFQFPPLAIGQRLLVVAPWMETVEEAGRQVLLLQPGMAFGTGHHPTTALVMEALEREEGLAGLDRMLDIGCGSGILSMAALSLGVARAEACDYDRDAVASAAENARLNNLQDRLTAAVARFPSLPFRPPWRLITANIYLTFFLQHVEALARMLAPGGVVLASGIAADQQQYLADCLEGAGLETECPPPRQEWGLVRACQR